LDQTTETSIYHREGEPGAYYYVKVRDAALPATDAMNASFIAFTQGAVRDLQNAFIWVDHYGLGGDSHEGFADGTTEGYSEYRLFVKKSQKIGKLSFMIINESETARDNMSIEFYGRGNPGQELMITRDDQQWGGTSTRLNYRASPAAGGWISLVPRITEKYKALVFGKNITLDGGGIDYPVTGTNESVWKQAAINTFIYLHLNSLGIMHDNSKITGYYNTTGSTPINVDRGENGKFYMSGGAITGNVMASGKGAITALNATTNGPNVFITGGTISNELPTGGSNNTKVSVQ
jgi:hypothetical protein